VDWITDFMGSIVAKRRVSRLQADLNRGKISFGGYVLRLDRRALLADGEPVALNGKAFELLIAFAESGGRVLTREELYERLWGEHIVEDANLSQTVYLLRRALDPDGDGRSFIETIPRIGYRFTEPFREEPPASRRPPRFMYTAATLGVMILTAVVLWPIFGPHATISRAARNADELGEYHLALRTPEHLAYALTYFKQAERLAPNDASAYAGAAAAYALLAEFRSDGSSRQRVLVSLAAASSSAALRHDERFSLALAVRGFIAYRFQDDRMAAERDLERALAADPGDAEAHLWNGVLLMREGQLAAATTQFETANRLAPTSEVYSRWLARAYAFERKPDQAIVEARETLRIEPDDAPAMLTIADAQEQRGDLESALNTLRTLVQVDPYEQRFVLPDTARLELLLRKGDASRLAQRVRRLAILARADPFETALLYLTLGRRAAAMRMLRLTDPSLLAIQRYDPRLLALL
jgi:DNA-binding winged helix-turn-helix (wHTH) protein/Flp pilus assembly protein TadD